MKLYHVTRASNLSSILGYGLQPKLGGTFRDPEVSDGEARTYLAEDPQVILDHALKYVGKWVVLEVQADGITLHPDPYDAGCYYTTERVPRDRIRVVRTYRR